MNINAHPDSEPAHRPHADASSLASAANCPRCHHPMARPGGAEPQLAACPSCLNPTLFANEIVEPCPAPGFSDLREEAVSGTVLGRVVTAVPERLNAMPVLPGVFQQVLGLIHDPISDINDLACAVEKDATLTLHLLKLANSPLYRGAAPVEDAHGACVRLGMKEIANVVWRVQCASAFRVGSGALRDTLSALWSESVAAAFCTRGIAALTKMPEREMAFLAGLTHAVGQTLLLQVLAAEPDFAIQRLRENKDRFRQLLERHGPLMSLRVLQHWGMPAPVRAAALYQRAPHLAPTPEDCRLAHLLVMGLEVARLCGYLPPADEADERRRYTSCTALGFMPEQLAPLANSLQVDLDDFVGSMTLD